MSNTLKKFNKIELNFFNKIKKEFKDDLLLYCVIGGLARGKIIENWSDIDILLVFNTNYDSNFWSKLNKLMSDFSSPIKIGYTFYSLNEFIHKKYKDPKTLHTINNIRLGIYKPRIKSRKINIDKIDLSMMKVFDNVDFTKYLHEIKRSLIFFPNYDEKKILKNIYTLSKIILRDKNIYTQGYKDTSKQIQKLNPSFYFFVSPKDIITKRLDLNKRYNFYLEFIKWIEHINYAKI